jgi:hypothetical protein
LSIPILSLFLIEPFIFFGLETVRSTCHKLTPLFYN